MIGAMKLDLNAAWDQAVRLIAVNREVMLVLGGVFFFLPYVLFNILVPLPDFATAAGPSGENTAALLAAMNGFLADYWWALLILSLITSAGAIAVMAVIGDPARPTVREAVTRGATYLLPMIAAQLITSLATTVLFFLAIMLGALSGSTGVAVTMSLFAFPVLIWLMTRWSLNGAVIAIEKSGNPIAALRRSWHLTAGNGLRLIAFYILLLLAFFVISQVIALLIGLVAALFTADTAIVIEALLSGLVFTALILIGYAILASVHRQFARAERTAAPDPAHQ